MKHSNIIHRAMVFALCLMLAIGSPAMASGEKTLRFGDSGSEVRAMQSALKALNYTVSVDGVFGEETLAAVKLYQLHSVMKVDGVAGPVTLEKLYADNASRDGVLRPGSRGDEVRRMQQALKDLNYPAQADGVFGPDTLIALKAFQARNGLRIDGAAGPNTLDRLYSGKALGYAGEGGLDTTAVVDTQRGRVLHLRSSRSDAGSKNILANIPSGTRLTVLSKGEGWTKVTYNSKTGYVRTGFLRFPSTPEKVKITIGSGEALVSTQPGRSLNLRSSQNSAHTANIIAYIPSGTVVGLIESGPAWSRISYGSLTGYVQSGYLQLP